MPDDDLNPYRSPEPVSDPAHGPPSPEPVDDRTSGYPDVPVTIASYLFPAEAEMLRILLDSHGIRAMVTDANIVDFTRLLSNAVGGVKLVVARKDAAEAAQIVEEHKRAAAPKQSLPPVTFECEECHAEITFPGHRRGKTETCPKCRAYVDVPE